MSEMEAVTNIRPLTAGEYHRMLDVGILYEREPVELLDGQLIAMPPEGPLHSDVGSALIAEFVRRFADRAVVRAGNPIALSAISEPQPDVAVVRPRVERYRTAHPQPDDVFFIVEVARSSLAYDHRKLRAYARGGVAEVWIVDLVHRRVEVYCEPHELGYASSRVIEQDGSIAPRAFAGDTIAVAAFLP